jgi:predicted phosphohydrolase
MTSTIATTTPSSTSSIRNKKVVRIRVTKETADHLRLLAHNGKEGWDDIIRRLISYYEEDKNSILREAKRLYLTTD